MQEQFFYQAIEELMTGTQSGSLVLEQQKPISTDFIKTDNKINIFSSKAPDNTTLGKEQFYSDPVSQQKYLESQHAKVNTEKLISHWAVQIVLGAIYIKNWVSPKVREIRLEQKEQEFIQAKAKKNPLFAIAYHQLLQKIFDTIIKATSLTQDNKLFYILKLNTLYIPGDAGIALNELREKLNAQIFNPDGSLAVGRDLHKITDLLNTYIKSTSSTIEEYIDTLEKTKATTNLPGFSKYIKKAKSGKAKLSTNNGFVRFCKKIKKEFGNWGSISAEVVLKNKDNAILLQFLELCQENLNSPKVQKFLDQNRDHRYYWEMRQLHDKLKAEALKIVGVSTKFVPKEIQNPNTPTTNVNHGAGPRPDTASDLATKVKEKYQPKEVNLTPKIPTTFVNNYDAPGNTPFLPQLPKVEPVKTPDKGGVIVSPENPVSEGAAPITAEVEVIPCGTGQLKPIEIDVIHIEQQNLPSLGDGMGLGDNNNPPEDASKSPKPEDKANEVKPESETETITEPAAEEDKVVISKPDNEISEVDSRVDKEKEIKLKIEAEKISAQDFEISISELKKLYGEDIVDAAIEINKDMAKYSNSVVIISIEQTTKDLLKINSNERWKLFKYEQGNVNLKLTRKNLEEALTGIAAEEQKFLNDLRRSSNAAEEFIDSNGFAWDVKTAKSRLPNGKAIFKETDFVESVKKEFRIGERVIIDITQLEKSDLDKLFKRLSSQLNAEEIEKTLIIHRTNHELSKKLGGYIGLLP